MCCMCFRVSTRSFHSYTMSSTILCTGFDALFPIQFKIGIGTCIVSIVLSRYQSCDFTEKQSYEELCTPNNYSIIIIIRFITILSFIAIVK